MHGAESGVSQPLYTDCVKGASYFGGLAPCDSYAVS